jgi:hypothetical protein
MVVMMEMQLDLILYLVAGFGALRRFATGRLCSVTMGFPTGEFLLGLQVALGC